MRGHVLVQLDSDNELADGLKRFVQLDLPPIDVEALLLQSLGDVARSHRSKELIILAGLARKRNFKPVKLLGERLGLRLLLG